METPSTKTILNVTLIVAIFVIGKKLGQKLGIFNTVADDTANQLNTGSTENINNTSNNAPPGLSLNPNYWKAIYKSIKPPVNGKKILNSLILYGTNPTNLNQIKQLSVSNLINAFIPKSITLTNIAISNMTRIAKLNTLEQTYAVLCLKVYDSKGLFKDDPDKTTSVFQLLNSKAQISYFSYVFTKIFDKDLFSYLNQFLNSEELTKISNIIKNKPLYTNIK